MFISPLVFNFHSHPLNDLYPPFNSNTTVTCSTKLGAKRTLHLIYQINFIELLFYIFLGLRNYCNIQSYENFRSKDEVPTTQNLIYHLPSTIYHLPSTIYHLPSTVYRLSSIGYRLPNTIYHRPCLLLPLTGCLRSSDPCLTISMSTFYRLPAIQWLTYIVKRLSSV